MSRIVEVVQGTEAWHRHRTAHFNASDAPAMLGVSSYKMRTQLAHELATGAVQEINDFTKRLFDDGHKYEAQARPWAEEIVGEELYPVTLADEVDGLPLSASLDGLTMSGEVMFEHKTLTQALAESLARGVVPEEHCPQVEQGLMLSGATKCLFMASNGNRETAKHCWYTSRPELRARLVPGWKQLQADVAAYQPAAVTPEAVGRTPETLPALRIEVTGMVTASNLDEFKSRAIEVFRAINTDLQTDQDFADAERTVKWCDEIETRLAEAKKQALGKTKSIEELFLSIDEISAEARNKRLELERLVKARKEAVRGEIIQRARDALAQHFATINATLSGVMLSAPATFAMDLAGAIKGKKTVASLQDAADTTLALAKIEASRLADQVRMNLVILAEAGHPALFADRQQLVTTKAPEDLRNLVAARVAKFKADEEARLEAERARIRAEEVAKLQAQEPSQRAPETPVAVIKGPSAQTPAAPRATARAGKATKPSDDVIVAAVAQHFSVPEATAIEWLLAMTLGATASKRKARA